MTGTTGGHLKQVSTVILLSILWSRLVLTLMPGHWGHTIQGRAKPAHPHACLFLFVLFFTGTTSKYLGQSTDPLPCQRTRPVIREQFSASSTDEEKVCLCDQNRGKRGKKRECKAMRYRVRGVTPASVSTTVTTEARTTTILLVVLTVMVMIRSHFPEGIYQTAGLYLHALTCVCDVGC